MPRFRLVLLVLAVLVFGTGQGYCAESSGRYFMLESGTNTEYIGLMSDGTYMITWCEHMGIFVPEKGRWSQEDHVITFTPDKKKGPYKGTLVTYKGVTFLAWKSEGAAGIVVPIEETKKELDSDPKARSSFSFYETTAEVYQSGVKQTHPFLYVKPNIKQRKK